MPTPSKSIPFLAFGYADIRRLQNGTYCRPAIGLSCSKTAPNIAILRERAPQRPLPSWITPRANAPSRRPELMDQKQLSSQLSEAVLVSVG